MISLILTQLKTHKNSVLKWLFHRYIGANYRYRIWTNFEKKVVHTLVSTRITNILGVGNKRPTRLFRFPIKINNEVDKKQYFDVIMVFVYQVPTFSQNIYIDIYIYPFWRAIYRIDNLVKIPLTRELFFFYLFPAKRAI